MKRISFIFFVLLILFLSCKKDDLTPSEMLIGNWQLAHIEGADTINSNTLYHYGTIIKKINYNGDPLVINTYKAWCERDTYYNNPPFVCDTTNTGETYNLIFYLHIYEDGKLKINEEYKDLDNTPLISQEYANSWFRHEIGLNHYEFQLNITPENWPNPKTKIINGLFIIQENDISTRSFTLKNRDFDQGEYTYIFIKM